MLEAHPDPQASDAAEADLLAGTPYRIIARIGSGGMGSVFEAEHEALGKRVVVKVLLPQLAREERLVDRLKREARVLARIASPHLVAVNDLGQTADGSTYLVMERLHGRTLGRELRARGVRMPEREVSPQEIDRGRSTCCRGSARWIRIQK